MQKYIVLTLFLLLALVPQIHAAPVISVQYSHRQVADRTVDPNIPEGCVIATFTSDEPAQVIDPPTGFETLDERHWRYIFTWDATDELTVLFSDVSADTTTIIAFVEPVIPLDPLQHEMPVLDIRTSAANLWDPATGIYIFGDNENCLQRGDDWERAAQFIYYNGSASPEFGEFCGLRINGGWSRRFSQKGLRFYFDDYGNSDETEYDFFGSQPSSFRRLILRCGINPRRCFTDVLAAETYADMGHLVSRWAPIVLYLNGEYWGFQPLRERIDEEFIEHTYNLDGSGYALIKDGATEHGDCTSFWAFLTECGEPGNFASHDFFLHAQETINLTSYIDWLLINIYGATTDNGSSANSAQFKPGDGPWEYLVWDEDGLFYFDNFWDNYFHFLSINSQEEYDQYRPSAIFTGSASARIRWAAPFRALLENSEFKQLFALRYHELMATWLSEESLDSRLDGIVARQEPEMIRHGERWDWPSETWYQSEVYQLHLWFSNRPGMLNNQFNNFMEYHRSPVELVQFCAQHQLGDGVTLEWNSLSEENCSGYVLHRGTEPSNLSALISWADEDALRGSGGIWNDAHYIWHDDTTQNDQVYFYQLAWVDRHGQEVLLPWVSEVSTSAPVRLVINEFLASNLNGLEDETGTCEDWAEIFNGGPDAVNLGGYFLTDNLSLPTRWEFPDTVLNSGEFLLVWCDSDPEDGPLHTNFKLSASGETIALLSPLADGTEIIDEHVFGSQVADISQGRQSDGGELWINFENPTPGATNESSSAVSLHDEALPGMPELLSVSPNPFNPSTTIRLKLTVAEPVTIRIYDIKGTLVRNLYSNHFMTVGRHELIWNGRDDDGRLLASGPYFLRINNLVGAITAKVLLVK